MYKENTLIKTVFFNSFDKSNRKFNNVIFGGSNYNGSISSHLNFDNISSVLESNYNFISDNFLDNLFFDFDFSKTSFYLYNKFSKVDVVDSFGNLKSDSRETSYFRIIFTANGVSSYEDFDFKDIKKTDLFYSKKNQFLKYLMLDKKFLSNKNYSVVFSPGMGGYFIHEVLGHLMEFDSYFSTYNFFSFNEKVSSSGFTVKDSIYGVEKLIGLNKIDDDGNNISDITIVDSGYISNFFDKNKFGCSRRQDYRHEGLSRMRSTFVESFGQFGFDDIVSEYNDCIVIDQILSGFVDKQSMFYQVIARGRCFENGIPKYRIDSFKITGNLKDTMKNIHFIGNDLKKLHAYCSKNRQILDVVVGSPSFSIDNLYVEVI